MKDLFGHDINEQPMMKLDDVYHERRKSFAFGFFVALILVGIIASPWVFIH